MADEQVGAKERMTNLRTMDARLCVVEKCIWVAGGFVACAFCLAVVWLLAASLAEVQSVEARERKANALIAELESMLADIEKVRAQRIR